MRDLPVFFTALAEEDLDQIVKPVLRILHAAQDWISGSAAKVSSQPVLDTASLNWKSGRGLG